MGIVEDLADDLARDTLDAAERLEDEKLVEAIAEILGASSTTAQEAFLTATRVRRAEARARVHLAKQLAKLKDGTT